ncbi:uncharacterized protein LOC121401191 [Xenopus laevis]|uniref:Uncharacterized protein LOC121401191 n=1 Tax=Xenopus laevis TaxID=8355 RepID=A0A8J1MJ97_XENLA|nr:uncharacterized protein LOC121401191 [Xenopus laevis]
MNPSEKKAETSSLSEAANEETLFSARDPFQQTQESLEEDLKKKLRILSKREISLSQHCATLAGYMRTLRMPRSLSSFLIPIFFQEDEEFLDQWNTILKKCSVDLMQLMVEGLRATLKQVREEITEVQQILLEILPEEDCQFREAELKGKPILHALEQDLEKYQREVLDYSATKKRERVPPPATTCTTYPSGSNAEEEEEEEESNSPTSSNWQKMRAKSPQPNWGQSEVKHPFKWCNRRCQGGRNGKSQERKGI